MPHHSKAAPQVLGILALVFGGIGGVGLLLAALSGGWRAASLSKMQRAEGTVVALRHTSRSYRPVVQFAPNGGAPVRFESEIGSSPPAFQVGEYVEVLYAPGNPSDALIDSFFQIWFFQALAAFIATPFALTGLGLFLASRRR
jgi:hypothetical protein